MEGSQIQDICRKIYQKHKKALDLLFEHRPDKQLEIHDCLVDVIEKDPDLLLDGHSKTYIGFIPNSLDFVPHEGEGWTKSKRILLFEVYNRADRMDSHLIIGPGPQNIRQKLYEIARDNSEIFRNASSKLYPKWTSLYKSRLLTKKEIEDKEMEEIRAIIEERIREFKQADLPAIQSELQKFKVK